MRPRTLEWQASAQHPAALVLDTNIVLDLLLFADPAAQVLRASLQQGCWNWLATQAMRDELERVLSYPVIAARMAYYQRSPQALLAEVDAAVQWHKPAPKAAVTCKDPDDQKFIDLAVQHRATLLSKDRAVWSMARRLAALGVSAGCALQDRAPLPDQKR
jgi:putative PIN family toxin of toxin-antitoxin system